MHAQGEFAAPARYNLRRQLQRLRTGPRDPCVHTDGDIFAWATHTEDGPAAAQISAHGRQLRATTHGPGAEALLKSLPRRLGLGDDPLGFDPEAIGGPAFARVAAHHRDKPHYFPASGQLFSAAVAATLHQLVTVRDAAACWRAMVTKLCGDAPGPVPLKLPPTPAILGQVSRAKLSSLGALGRQGETIHRLVSRAAALQRLAKAPAATAFEKLQTIRGVGPWTAAVAVAACHGDPDLVPQGDAKLPRMVTHAITSRADGTDADMAELLAPFAPNRARLVGALASMGFEAPGRKLRARAPHRPGWRG